MRMRARMPRRTARSAHFACGCEKTAALTAVMYEDLAKVKGVSRRQVEQMKTESEEVQWVWLNRMVDARTDGMDGRTVEVTRIVFKFLNDALSEHPYYGREQPRDKEGGEKQRSNVPYKWTR